MICSRPRSFRSVGVREWGERDRQVVIPGVCIWLTGRSGAGKSTVTAALIPMLEGLGRTVSVYDVVPLLAKRWFERTSEGKLLRKAYVAGEVARHGGIAICVTVSARAEIREKARAIVGSDRFLEVYVDVPPDVSAARRSQRTKKPPLLKRIRRSVRALRGGESGYQVPSHPDLTIDTVTLAPEENARALMRLLIERGFVEPSAPTRSGLAPHHDERGKRAATAES